MVRRRVAVLISGGGSNLQALLDATAAPDAAAEIVLVVSNEPGAHGLRRAAAVGVACRILDHRGFVDRAAFDAALDGVLRDTAIELVCLAGFMRILTPDFVARWPERLLNIHPSLLPAFPGLRTHARALAAGVRVHGCTVHLVGTELDAGPIVSQGVVPVLSDDTEATLAARVLELEHRCYPPALQRLAAGTLGVTGDRSPSDPGMLVLHPLLFR